MNSMYPLRGSPGRFCFVYPDNDRRGMWGKLPRSLPRPKNEETSPRTWPKSIAAVRKRAMM